MNKRKNLRKNTHYLIFAATLSLLISGCYGPDYEKPAVTVPMQWNSPDKLSQTSKADLPMLHWWEQFHDPVLSHLVMQALKNNNDIHAALGNVTAAQGQLEQIQFSILPTLNVLMGYTDVPANFLNTGYTAGFIPGYSLNLFQFIRSREYASANLASVNAAKDAVRLTVISQTVGGYFAYLAQSDLLTQQETLTHDLGQLLSLSRLQYEKGLISLYTLQQYEQQYDAAKAELAVIQNNVVVSQNALRLLLNENPGNISKGSDFAQLKSNHIIPVNLPSTVLKNRPDVRMAEENLIAANANVGVASSTFFPTVALTGVAGTASDGLNGLFSSGTDYWNREISANMPVLSMQTYGQIKQTKGEYYAAYYQYIQTVRTAFQSVDNDLSAHEKYYANFTAQSEQFHSSKKAYDLAKISYEKGLYSYPTLLENKINMDNAGIVLTKSKLAQLNTIVQLYQDLGGGYVEK